MYIQLAKKAVEEAFPNIVTHFTVNTSDAFFSFHYYVPSLFYSCLISSTSAKSNSTTYLTPVPTPFSTFMSSGEGGRASRLVLYYRRCSFRYQNLFFVNFWPSLKQSTCVYIFYKFLFSISVFCCEIKLQIHFILFYLFYFILFYFTTKYRYGKYKLIEYIDTS